MDEAALAKALDGKFYWEPTTKYEPQPPRATLDIRRAQSKYVPKDSYYIPNVEVKNKWWENPKNVTGLDAQIKRFRDAISVHFSIAAQDFVGRSKGKHSSTPKKFYSWGLCRYFPEVPIIEMARRLGKHHSTIIYGRDEFKSEEHLHADLIAKMDAYMGYEKCGS